MDQIEAKYQTKLYDAVAAAYDQLQAPRDPDDISAIILLTDGVDYATDPATGKPVGSAIQLDELLKKVKVDGKKDLTLIYTIAYGSEDKAHGGADPEILQKISEATKAKFFRSTKDDVKNVMKEIFKYF